MAKRKISMKYSLPVIVFKEGKSFIAYTPALDLSTVSDTFSGVKKSFNEAIELFFEEISEKGTFKQVLTELGWQERNKGFVPPHVISQKTETFSVPVSLN